MIEGSEEGGTTPPEDADRREDAGRRETKDLTPIL